MSNFNQESVLSVHHWIRALLNARGFVEGNHGEPAQFVVEKAFAER